MQALAVIALFVAIGPVVGLLVFAGGMTVLSLAVEPIGRAWMVGAFFLMYGVIFAHYIGAASAAVAGAFAAAAALLLGRAPAWIGPLSGAVAFAFAWLAGLVTLSVSAMLTHANLSWGPQSRVFVLMAVVHVATAAVMWLMARPLMRRSLIAAATKAS